MNYNYNFFGLGRDTKPKTKNPASIGLWRFGFMKSSVVVCFMMLLLLAGQNMTAQASAYGYAATTGAALETINTPTVVTSVSSGSADDGFMNVAPVGFTFPYVGTNYTTFRVGTNGYVIFGSTAPSTTIPSSLTTHAGFAGAYAFGRDANLNTGNGGNLTHGDATGGKYVFQLTKNSGGGSGGTSATNFITFQIVLWGTTSTDPGKIEIIYGTSAATPGSAGTIGIRDVANTYLNGVNGLNSSTATLSSWPASGTKYTFTAPLPCSGTPTPGTIPTTAGVCIGGTTGTTLTATGYTSGVTGITFQWEESDDNGVVDTWANAVGGSGATTATYTTPVVAANIYYRLKVTCSGSDAFTNASLVSPINCSFDIAKSASSYVSIAGTGTSLTGTWRNGNSNTDDNLSASQNIGFTFPYKGGNYSTFSVSTNGYLTFNTGTTAVGSGTGAYGYDNPAFTSTTGTLLSLAPYYEDLVTPGNPGNIGGLNGAFKYALNGTAPNRVATIEWIGMETFNNAGPNLNFQIKLHETTGVIEYNYGTFEQFAGTANYGYSYTVGVNGATVAASPTVNQLQTQQIENTQAFSNVAKNTLSAVMSCNTTYTFTPGTYSGALAPAALTNDEPGTAIGLTVNPSPCTGFCGTYYSSKNATASAGITTCGAGTPGTPDDDVWFTFVASTSQQTITVRGGAGYNPVVQLFSDAGITPLNCVNATGAGLTETINATGLTASATYYVRVYHEATGSSSTPTAGTTTAAAGAGDFSICVNEIVPPPANDDICGAVNLSVGTSCSATAGSTVNSTASAQAVCGGTADDDVWYSFTASTATDVVTVQSGAGFNAHFQVWSSSDNTCTGTLTSVACVNNTSTAGTETFTGTSLVPGNVYFIRIYHSASGTGTGAFTVCVTAAPPACIGNPTTPANGGTACENTPVTLTFPAAPGATSYNIVLDGGAPINQTGTSYNAGVLALGGHTWSVSPVNNAGAATGCNSWTFTVESQPVIGTISGPSALFTAQSGSFSETGGTGGILQWQSATVTGGPYSNIATATGNPQNISFAGPGTYYIVATRTVGGCTVVTSNELTVVVSVQGDTPCAPIALVVGSNGPYSNAGATVDPSEVAPPGTGCSIQTGWCNTTLNNTIWGTFTAPASGRVTIQASGFDDQLALYTATNCADYTTFTLLAANDDSGDENGHGGTTDSAYIDAICLIPGNTYYVQLDGYSATGTATIVITEVALTVPTFTAVPPVCNGTVAALPTTSINNITGTWSPAINPNATTVYTFTPDAGQCAASTTLTITVPSTTWNGAAWSNSAPTSATLAIFEGAYSSTGDLSACRVLVNSGAVTVNSGNDFTVANAVTVNGGSLTFENNANLLQTTNAANSGAITVKRNATMRRLDYVYWGSPVAAQNLKAFSPQTVSPPVGASRFYTMDETTNSFSVISAPENATFTLAKGYMLRAPNNFPTNGSQATFNGEFNGVPNNGDAAIAITNTPGTGQGYNMLGNPYPSTVSADLFLAQNPGALYFWAHANQNAASGANYATYTTFGTAAAAGGATPDGSIAVGQGFLLKTAASGTATFTNAMRTGNNTAVFFRNATVEKSRIWLNLSDATGTQNQILVGYMDGATNDADVSVDAKQIEGNISNIASLIAGEKYNIQARALPFTDTDEIPLSFNALAAGTFSIGIDHVDGLFTGDQNVYVKDNVSGIIHNIKESAYTFAAEAGTSTNRFSVVFQSTTLGIENPAFDANSVVVYKNNDVLNINSGSMTMSGVKVFDIRGRLIFEQSGINANTAALTNLRAAQEVLLVQITSADNKVVTKKVVY